ncbi:hypothetical protein KP803_17180 [Vibrio sp. ZSDE26]|uniref:Uncharacterized protein n=1 Tax=Vibrio amylolyticus TaxID=2847292 RepID=A0A9X1XSZ8_9VIBR|nr:hypothetical protein [Vibrio amylolyticus]MCK6265014.1 hypothetical protein [Vibrio amylolyticus]
MDKAIEIGELEALITWLHEDVYETLKDTNDKVATAQYEKVFNSTSLLKEILIMSESNKNYI